MSNDNTNNEARIGLSLLNAELERLRIAAGIELDDSFEGGSKWCVGDEELKALILAAKAEEREACKQLADNVAEDCEDNDNGFGANAARDISDLIAERSNALT